jgi:hypothetical protein
MPAGPLPLLIGILEVVGAIPISTIEAQSLVGIIPTRLFSFDHSELTGQSIG